MADSDQRDQLYFLTFNCNKILDTGFVQQARKTFPAQMPQFAVFGFQEVCSVFDSTDAAVVNRIVMQINEQLVAALTEQYGVEFQTVAMPHVGAVAMVVATPFASRFKAVRPAAYSCGMSYSSLKGACGLRFECGGAEYTVVVAHLAANEGAAYWRRRDRDAGRILAGLDFGDGYAVYKPRTHVFFMGDLNYRVVRRGATVAGADPAQLLAADFAPEKDELRTSMERGSAFWGFSEAPIAFQPSYKFFNGTAEYNMKRNPSWCDRVLFVPYADGAHRVHHYDTVARVLTSDHHPVYLDIAVPRAAPDAALVDQNGYLVADAGVYMRPGLVSRAERVATAVADHALFAGLYLALTSKGRFVVALVVVALAAQLYF